MNNKAIYQYLLSTDGVNQLDRNPAALDPESVKVDGRSKSEILRFIYELSKQIRFYGTDLKPKGDWRSFFDRFLDEQDLIGEEKIEAMLSERSDLPPHLALLFAFLHIFSYLQEDLNKLPLRRLNYYYEDLLQMERKLPQPDQVHAIFQLAKNADPYLLEAGSQLDAGKTNSGLPLRYTLDHDLVVTKAAVSSLKSSFKDYSKDNKSIIYKADDATSVVSEGSITWRPFGSKQQTQSTDTRSMEPTAPGWAVASPNLFLAEGRREVSLRFHLNSLPGFIHPGLNLVSKIDVEVTSEEGWLKADTILNAELKPDNHTEDQDPDSENSFTLDVSVLIRETSPPVTSFNSATHEGTYLTSWPVIRILLKSQSFIREILSEFHVDQIAVEVDVRNVRDLILQNDQALQPTDGPILPFGSFPSIGSNFYIGSEEAFSKSLTSLEIKLEWQDPPKDFNSYYQEYGDIPVGNLSFEADIELLAQKKWVVQDLSDESRRLFVPVDTSRVKDMRVPEINTATGGFVSPFSRKPDLSISDSYQHTLTQGFIRIILKEPKLDEPPDAPFEAFGHKTFPVAYARQAIALSKFTENGDPPKLPVKPYTPTLKSVVLNYTAGHSFRPSNPNGTEQFFVQHTFGVTEIGKNDSAVLISSHPGEGALYIGLEGANSPQLVSLLFQIEEGSVLGAEPLRKRDITWSYLSGNQWHTIAAGDIIEDSTNAFQKPGIIRLTIGRDATDEHSRMPPGLKWLRASVMNYPDGAAAVMSISTQAARATLVIEDSPAEGVENYEEHLSQPLAPSTIKGLIPRQGTVKGVEQPYPSFGGRPSESNRAFYIRVSERLRHKKRTVTRWDYERLILQAFPEIFKVKCLPHYSEDNKLQPGSVRLVVVPDWSKRLTGDPLQPSTDQNLLDEIAQFLEEKHTSPFVATHVSNPFYETLLVDCKIRFRSGYDPGYFSSLLDEELKKFLSPWAYEEGEDIVFGGKIYASEILAFVEEREYVDFVVDFNLYHRHGGHLWQGIGEMEIGLDFVVAYTPEPTIASSQTGAGGKTINLDFVVGEPVDVAVATRPDTILVSNASHRIRPLQEGGTSCRGVRNIGIGDMIIGIDFVPVS